MPVPNLVHLLPERDRLMAETYTQNADGSANPTGEADPAEAPAVHHGPELVGKVVEAPAKDKPKGQSRASSKATKKS